MQYKRLKKILHNIDLDGLAASEQYLERCHRLYYQFESKFGAAGNFIFVSAPGRVEIGGNHTDHQHGCVLSASIHLDALGIAAPNNKQVIRLHSEGYETSTVALSDLSVQDNERGQSSALVRGVADGFVRQGYRIGGFDAYLSSDVLFGSGLSSSAAFEMWVGTAINHLFNNGEVDIVKVAKISQYAENEHFDKPCGLQDQMASGIGGIVFIDFAEIDQPVVQRKTGKIADHTLCVIDSGAHHAELTDDYAGIREEMTAVAAFLGKEVLRQVPEHSFIEQIPAIRKALGDRAILRALHFFAENKRAILEKKALRSGNTRKFLSLVNESGRSSYMYLQNVIRPGAVQQQELAVCLGMCEHWLDGKGASRVQGGGFAGTVEAFVPNHSLADFKKNIQSILGDDSCHVLSIRPLGATVFSDLGS